MHSCNHGIGNVLRVAVGRTPKGVLGGVFGACLVAVLAQSSPAQARSPEPILDILVAEAVGELRGQTYDAYRQVEGNDAFVGALQVPGGTFLGAGFGLRLIVPTRSGLRFSGELSIQGGRVRGEEAPWPASSTMVRMEALTGLGYQVQLGPLVLHAAAILGGDFASFKTAQPTLLPSAGQPLSIGSSLTDAGDEQQLRRWGLRLGAQAGAHIQLAKSAGVYSDVTFDYDGQWRVRSGIFIGNTSR
jgi:hypothetical protein